MSRPSPDPGKPPVFQSDEDFSDTAAQNQIRRLKTKRLILNLLTRWYWGALGMVLGFLAAQYYLSKAPKKYSSSATLLIKQESVGVIGRDQPHAIDMRSVEGLNTAAVRIRRLELLERVASRMDVRALPGLIPPGVDWRPEWFSNWMDDGRKPLDEPQPETLPDASSLAGWINAWLDVSIRRGTRLIDITISHQVPEVAKALADAVAREYLAELAGALSEGRSSKSETLLRQSEEVRAKLQSAESALASYNRAIEVHKTLETQENLVSQLARRYKPKHPKMIAANTELDGIKQRFLDEFAVAVSSPSDESYWKAAGRQDGTSQGDQESRLRAARQLLLARIGVLKGEISSQMSVFNVMITRLEESNVNREADQPDVEISSYARVAGGPSAPNRNDIIKKGCAAGLGAGFAFAFLLMLLNNKLHSVAQVEADTGHPVLAAVADINLNHLGRAARNHARKHPGYASDPLQDAWDPRLLFRPGISTTTYAEMFRILRASISLLGDETQRKITLFSSALPGEGKSLISANFALAAAGQGRRTLLIDLDLRKPDIHRQFGFVRSELGSGATEWLAGKCDFDEAVVRDLGAGNLHAMFCGARAPNPGELLNISRLKELLAIASSRYDLIVVDSAPLLAVPDTRVIAPLADNFCLVVRADYVPRGAVMRTLELLSSADSPPSGLVFNCFKENRSMIGQNYSYGGYRLSRYGRPYRYGYGSYGSYGAYGADDSGEGDPKKSRRRLAQKPQDSGAATSTGKST
jgi:succinoglycan biosynthesis transport protein ExoP